MRWPTALHIAADHGSPLLGGAVVGSGGEWVHFFAKGCAPSSAYVLWATQAKQHPKRCREKRSGLPEPQPAQAGRF